MLADYYFADPRLTLVPIEHLSPLGLSAELAMLLAAERGWTAAHVALFDRAFALYWQRTATLARLTRTWAAPRLRHVAIVHDPLALRPYAQLLNTSAWTAYASDFDPVTSHPELAAYVLVHGERMALTGEVTQAAVLNAAYWFDRSEEERAAFSVAAEQSTRPDAAAFRALAAAIPWMQRLWHETLRPPRSGVERLREIPRTGLLVPHQDAAKPPALVARWTAVAEASVAAYHRRWQQSDAQAVGALCAWLEADRPSMLITAGARIVWDGDHSERLGALRYLLRDASGAAVADVHADLEVMVARTRSFHAAVVDPHALLRPDPAMAQSGYSFVHPARGLITYNVLEPGMERLRGPALPYARAMLGARTIHEWAHLAVDAGWIPCATAPAELDARVAALNDLFESTIPPVKRGAHKGGPSSPGTSLAQLTLARLPDFQANLLAQRFLTLTERETYIRHNIRTLRGMYAASESSRALIRYLFEYQYLRFSAVDDRRTFFLSSTGFNADFIATGALDDEQFDQLAAAVAHVCDAFAVDESRFRSVAGMRRPNQAAPPTRS